MQVESHDGVAPLCPHYLARVSPFVLQGVVDTLVVRFKGFVRSVELGLAPFVGVHVPGVASACSLHILCLHDRLSMKV